MLARGDPGRLEGRGHAGRGRCGTRSSAALICRSTWLGRRPGPSFFPREQEQRRRRSAASPNPPARPGPAETAGSLGSPTKAARGGARLGTCSPGDEAGWSKWTGWRGPCYFDGKGKLHLFILMNKVNHLLSTDHVPGTVLDAEDTKANKRCHPSCPPGVAKETGRHGLVLR